METNTVKKDEELNKHSNIETLIRLLKYLKHYKLKSFIVIIILIFVMIVGLLNPYLLKNAIDTHIVKKDIQSLVMLGAIMLLMNFMAMLASKVRIELMASITNNILLTIRHNLYAHIQKLSFSFFDNRPVGKILARVIGDVNSLQDLFNNAITSFIPEVLTIICVTSLMFYMNLKLALASIIILPILGLSMFFIETISRKRWQLYRQKRSNFNAFTHEDFSGIKIIQAFAAEKKTYASFKTLVIEMNASILKALKMNDLFWPMVDFSSGLGTVIVFWYSTKLLNSNDISVGTLIAFMWYINMFWRPIINLTTFYNTLVTNFSSAERIFDILDIKPNIVNLNSSVQMPIIQGEVEFKNVSFAYNENKVILNNVSFKIEKGDTIALVRPTGAGKTTIINLISRFYDASEGEILIDNINIKNVNLESLRSQMGIMLQDTFLFSDTIMENIRYGKLNATDEEVIAAARAVNAHTFILKLVKGYDTNVNERGSRLSVGQRQLISFARALLANPRILILDEATSNIDTHTEKLVQEGIEKLLHERTSFVIAHRLSTIRDCNKIMVVNEGNIVETGTHEELLKLEGLYYNLYMSQYKFLNEGA